MTASVHEPADILVGAVGSWQLDAAATTVSLTTTAIWGLVRVRATLAATKGEGTLGPEGHVEGSLAIDAASIDSGNRKRDDHLRSVQFLNAEDYPDLTFVATGITPVAEHRCRVAGVLTVRRRSEPVALEATVSAEGQDRIGVHAEFDIDRARWGIAWTAMGASMINHIKVDAVFVRQHEKGKEQ
jgi:polyisoprenoid-binding protein YceI